MGAIVVQEEGEHWTTYPKGAVEFMRARRVSGRVWNDVNVGGYLIWHLHPACRVFMDPRLEHVYSAEQMDDYAKASAALPGWEMILEKYGPDYLLLPVDSPLASAAASGAWKAVYRDPDQVLLSRGYKGETMLGGRPPLPWLFP